LGRAVRPIAMLFFGNVVYPPSLFARHDVPCIYDTTARQQAMLRSPTPIPGNEQA